MNGLQYALQRVHDAERRLIELLDDLTTRHSADHEVVHVGTNLRGWSAAHVRLLAERGPDYDVNLDDDTSKPGPLHRAAAAVTELVTHPNPGVLLLDDMQDLYLAASHASLAWEMLAQIAQARHERQLLQLVGDCHPETLRQIRWANTMLKTLSPQLLSAL